MFDLINAGIYAARGKWGDAGLSFAAVVPGLGASATVWKLGRRAAKTAEYLDAAGGIARHADELPGAARLLARADDASGPTARAAADIETRGPPLAGVETHPAIQTGKVSLDDASQTVGGPNGALRDVATGRFAPNPARLAPSPSSGLHGNSLASTRPTTLYQLTDDAGAHLKWGITSEANPMARYSAAELQGRFLNPIQVGSRADTAALERWFVERAPGPMNLEPWAGTVQESIFGGLTL